MFFKYRKEEIEEMKSADVLEKLILEMSGSQPEVTRVFLDERDQYLTRSIWDLTGMKDFQAKSRECVDSGDQLIRKRKNSTNTNLTSNSSVKCCSNWPSIDELPRVIVAIVGIGHVSGILRLWSTAHLIKKNELLK